MTGPERHVLRAAAALTLEASDRHSKLMHERATPYGRLPGGTSVSAVAELSKYPDLEDRRHIVSLERRGYVTTWTAQQHQWGTHKRVALTAKGWLDVMESR